jgi:hypothetical protein
MYFIDRGQQYMKKYCEPLNQNEVAAVFVNEKNENLPPQSQHLCITNKHGGKLKTIPYTDSMCDPLVYPLFFPGNIYETLHVTFKLLFEKHLLHF